MFRANSSLRAAASPCAAAEIATLYLCCGGITLPELQLLQESRNSSMAVHSSASTSTFRTFRLALRRTLIVAAWSRYGTCHLAGSPSSEDLEEAPKSLESGSASQPMLPTLDGARARFSAGLMTSLQSYFRYVDRIANGDGCNPYWSSVIEILDAPSPEILPVLQIIRFSSACPGDTNPCDSQQAEVRIHYGHGIAEVMQKDFRESPVSGCPTSW